MKNYKKILSCIILTFILVSVQVINISAASNINIYTEPKNIEVKQGESVVVDLMSDSDFTAAQLSALAWSFDIGSITVEQEGDSDFYITVNNNTGLIKIGAVYNEVDISAGKKICSLKFTIANDARIGKHTVNNINNSIYIGENLEKLNLNVDDIIINVISSEELEPTPTPLSEATEAPTSKPTSRPSGNTNNGVKPTSNPTATPVVSASPVPTSTPEATVAPTASPSGQIFEDVDEDYWAYGYIMDLYTNNIINGDEDGNFYPEKNVTRAEFTKMAVSLFKIETGTADTSFIDIPADEWYAEYVAAAAEAGIVTGTSETIFSPNETVTREQMATIIGRKLNLTSESASEYADADTIADYALGYVTGLTEAGYLTGDDSGMFRPQATATRAESAALLSRVRTSNTAE